MGERRIDCYISETFDYGLVKKSQVNLIVGSCGTGKSYFCANVLPSLITDVSPKEILFVTSRSIAADQQASEYDSLVRFTSDDTEIIKFWRGLPCDGVSDKIRIMTYDKIISLVFGRSWGGNFRHDALTNVKVVVFDEIHSMFSDMFISGMNALQMWVYHEILIGEKLFFGVTATPGILFDHIDGWGVNICVVNKPMQRYKASQLWCVDIKGLTSLITDKFKGKTIIMCRSVRSCYSLQKLLPGSAVLTGKSGGDYIPCDMDSIRRSIVNNYVLPPGVDILIASETLREGFSLIADSGIRNVVCFFQDEMNIHQFAGRCRFNIDNLVVVKHASRGDAQTYFKEQESQFADFCLTYGKDSRWFENVSDIIAHKSDDTKFLLLGNPYLGRSVKPKEKEKLLDVFSNRGAFDIARAYIRENLFNIAICGQNMRENILDDFKSLGIVTGEMSNMSWKQFEALVRDLDFEIKEGRMYVDGKRVRYKTICEEGDEQK